VNECESFATIASIGIPKKFVPAVSSKIAASRRNMEEPTTEWMKN
jgi:hypothetical protein